jgi:putative hemolysin
MEGSSVVIYTELLLFLLLLFLSGFFSSSEVVFFGTNRFLLRKYSQRRFYSLVNKLLAKPKEILVSILIGNEIVNVLISAYGTKLFISHFGEKGTTISACHRSILHLRTTLLCCPYASYTHQASVQKIGGCPNAL